MKKYLFLDNYRGFSNAIVPLVDVNFLVGENSSGKTSVLGLLRLLSSYNLFMGEIMGVNEGVQFGHFNEVVSIHAEDRSYFRVGFVEEGDSVENNRSEIVNGLLLSYREHSGIPRLERITCSLGSREISVNVSDDAILFKSTEFNKTLTVEETKNCLLRWNIEHRELGDGWKQLTMPKGTPAAQLPLYFLLHQVMRKTNDEGAAFPPLFSGFNDQLVWIAPIRSKPKRTYDEPTTSFSPEGSHIPYAIRKMLSSQVGKAKFKIFMDKIGRESGLFQSIITNEFGTSSDAPFEVDVVLDGKEINLTWVGYGVSQSLPILVELLDRPDGSWFAIQQPEVHLHPRAQAALGDVFFEMSMKNDMRFIIETHSDFTIDRFRMNYRRKRSKKEQKTLPQSQILFFERQQKQNTVTPLLVGPRGEMPTNQPDGYRDFFIKEEMHLLDV